MDKQTMKEMHNGIYELYSEMYNNQVEFQLLDEETTGKQKNNIYNESQNKVYKDKINLLAKINLKPALDEISIIGQNNKIEGQITVPYLEMVNNDLDKLSINTLCKAKVNIFHTEYNIINVLIETTFNNDISKYIFEIRRCI